jgi:hypothetical protein
MWDYRDPSRWWENPQDLVKFISNMSMQAILVHKVIQNIGIETIEFMLSKRHFVLLYKSSRHGLQDAAERPLVYPAPTNSGHVLNAYHYGISYPNSSL